MSNLPKVGSRICIIGDHPHAGKAVTVLKIERLPIIRKHAACCEADNGDHFYVTSEDHWTPFPTNERTQPRAKPRGTTRPKFPRDAKYPRGTKFS